MLSTYKKMILKELEEVPEEMMPKLYKVFHILTSELMPRSPKRVRGSLKGIWKGSIIDESLLDNAKESLFSYEHK